MFATRTHKIEKRKPSRKRTQKHYARARNDNSFHNRAGWHTHTHTLDYDEASFNQVEFLTMSNVYCSMTVVAPEEFPKRRDKKTKKTSEAFRCHHSGPAECLDGAPTPRTIEQGCSFRSQQLIEVLMKSACNN